MSDKNKKIYLVFGDDEFAVKTKSRAIMASICGDNFEENPALDIIHGDSDEKESPAKLVGQIIEAVYTPPFLSEEKIVWAKNFPFEILVGAGSKTKAKRDSQADSSSSKVFDDLVALLKTDLPEKVSLLLTVFNVDKRSALYKACAKNAELHEFEKISLENRNLVEILSSQIGATCRDLGINISKEAENFLLEACGASHSRVINEIEKIASYIYPRTEASIEDCLQICSMTPELASWAFSEAIGRKDIKAAIKALDILVSPKNPEHRVLYSIIGLFADMAQVKIAVKAIKLDKCSRYPEFDYKLKNITDELKDKYSWTSLFSMNPYRAFKLFQQSQKFSEGELAEAFQEILKVNKALVSGAANPRLELENLSVKLCKS